MRSLLWIIIILASIPAQAATYNVYPDGSGDFATIQEAIYASIDGGVVQLADGVFTGPGNRDLDTDEIGVTLKSMSGDPLLCVIDCQGSQAEPHFGISYSALGADTILRGITVRNGYSATAGGGLQLSDAAITVENCIFEDNYAYYSGGAVYAAQWSSPSFTDCLFQNNTAYEYGQGGAICAQQESNLNIDRCIFAGNQASYGGALYFENGCLPTVQSSTFWGNSGSAIRMSTDCVLTMTRSILAFNGSLAVQGLGNAQAQLSCCDVFGNPSGNWVGILAGQGTINNNLEANPIICDPAGGDFSLNSASPCTEYNNANCGLVGALPMDCWSIITVAADGSGDYPTIQEAIDAATSGVDIVELLDGLYVGAGNREVDFLGKAITVRSASGDPAACIVRIGGALKGFIFWSGEGPDSVLQDVTITDAIGTSEGGAMRIDHASPTIENCIFEGNSAHAGSGVYISGGNPSFNNCDFVSNRFEPDFGYGAAVYCNSGGISFTGCRFLENGPDASQSRGDGSVLYASGVASLNFLNCIFANNANEEKSIFWIVSAAGPVGFDGCTFYGNSTPVGSLFKIESEDPMTVTMTNSIVAFNSVSDWIRVDDTSQLLIGCCNVYGNSSGDWVGPVADQLSNPANISIDPKFCDAQALDFSLEATSPCLPLTPPNQFCEQIGAEPQGCDYRGIVTSVADVPNDQGRRVRVSWSPSSQDNSGTPYGITNYSIWRKINDPQRKAIRPPADKSNHADKFPDGDWDYVTSVPARGEYQYNVLCETIADSTLADGNHLSTFFVSAETSESTLYFDSLTASGYSVDNLAPGVPENMRLETSTILAWDEVSAADFDYFTVYGSSSGALDGSESELGKTTTLEMAIPETSYPYYLLTATDYSGNEGQAAILVTGLTGVEDGTANPTRFALYRPWPNPGTRGTNFSFDLPRSSMVNITIYDLAGRKVSTVVNSVLSAGNHVVSWTGKNNGTSGSLASGVYFYRMKAGEFNDSGRVMILK